MRILRSAALASVLSVSLAADAKADGSLFFDNYCIMGSFQVCASVRLYTEGNVLRMRVWNMDDQLGSRHTITAVGLYHSGTQYDWSGSINSYTVDYNGTDITQYWTENSNNVKNLGGALLEIKEGTAGNAGIIGCNDPGGNIKWATCGSFAAQPYVEFTFNLSSAFSLSNVELRWHSMQVGPDEESLKCDTGGAGDYPDCVPQTAVPEPATIVLLGTGIASVAGFSRRRRKSRQPTV